jgi:hypothetical protein
LALEVIDNSLVLSNHYDVDLIISSCFALIILSYFALRKGLRVTAIASFFSDKVPKCVIVRIVSYFDLNPLIDSVLFFYNDVLCIDNLV